MTQRMRGKAGEMSINSSKPTVKLTDQNLDGDGILEMR